MKVGELCSGYGGISLGLGVVPVWVAEIDEVLAAATQPDVPNLGDITTVDWSKVQRVDLLTAGFPCQPVSAAGAQLGERDPRWLWPWVRDAIAVLAPERVLLENVRNLISISGGELWQGILDDLGRLSYDVRWLTLGACHVGAAHHRHRVFALATRIPVERRGFSWPIVERVATSPCGARGEAILPTARDGDGRGTGDAEYWDRRLRTGRTNGFPLDATVALLPTPTSQNSHGNQVNNRGELLLPGIVAALALLPTPTATDRNSSDIGAGPGQRGSSGDLAMSSAVQPDNWGRFAQAVARHAAIYGDPPAPTEPNRNGAPRLAPAFAKWLMCLPAGHVTSKLARVPALKAIGNGVCPPQLAAAWRLLTDTTAVLDVSLGRRVASGAVTTSQEVKEMQERGAAARARVIAAGGKASERQSLDAFSPTPENTSAMVEAAMMELVAVWRENADAIEKAKRKGHVTTAKELRQAASRLAGFAVGLTTRSIAETPYAPGVDLNTTTEVEAHEPQCPCSRPECVALYVGERPIGSQVEVGGVTFTKIGDNPFGATASADPIMDFLTGKSDTYTPAPRPEQILDELKRAPVITPSMLAVDNPFTSPGPPGANRAPVAAVPYAALDGLARKLAADKPRDHVSHSYVRDYESCSLQALLSDASRAQVIGARRPGWSLIGGNAFHSAIEFVERAVIAGDLAVLDHAGATGLANVNEFWGEFVDVEIKNTMERTAGGPYADPSTWYVANGGREGFDWWRVEGAAMLARYLEHHDAAWREKHKILMVGDTTPVIELPYTMAVRSLDGTTSYEAQGFIDSAWLSLDDYHITIVDYKSGKTGPAETFQLGEYAHALLMAMGLAEAPPGRPIMGSYWLARQGRYTPPVDVIAAHPLVELQYRYGAAMRGTQAGIFTPHLTNLCNSCGVRDYCPAQVAR